MEDTYTHVLVVGSSDPEGTKIEIKGELKLKSDIEGIAEQGRVVRRYMRAHNGSGYIIQMEVRVGQCSEELTEIPCVGDLDVVADYGLITSMRGYVDLFDWDDSDVLKGRRKAILTSKIIDYVLIILDDLELPHRLVRTSLSLTCLALSRCITRQAWNGKLVLMSSCRTFVLSS